MASQSMVIVFGVVALLIAAATGGKIQFSYNGENGPLKWGSLSPDFSNCSNGRAQSPINIVTNDAVANPKLQPLTRDYVNEVDGTLINHGFNVGIQFDKESLGDLTINGKNYSFHQLHWHSPSDHTLDGERFPLELHMVHKAPDGSITVVAIFFRYGNPDALLKQVEGPLNELTSEKNGGGDGEAHVEVTSLKTHCLDKKTRKYFRYVGSLTTPPCTENVIWNIVGKVREVAKEQVDAIRAPVDAGCKDNARPLQALNGRKVEVYHGQ
ncbi:hypothetical protein Syun_002542 [Stephania yunnanensis]|uniref:Alpha-carbonic anhydrase domain-containing protein n=1 Tax=Stephania yunnanensis TaxID=152371 RepID=A0AAP0LHV4_9MAGN